MRLRQALDARDLFAFLFRVHDIDGQVRSVETADKRFGFGQAQLLNYVGTNVRRGRRGEGKGLNATSGAIKGLDHTFQAQIIGTEVVAPG